MDTKEAIQSVGAMLTVFLKSGPDSPSHSDRIQSEILEIVDAVIVSPELSTESYKKRCDDFLQEVIRAEGPPVRRALSVDDKSVGGADSKKPRRRKSKTIPMPELMSRYNSCVEDYGKQSELYLNGVLAEFRDMLGSFVEQVPIGGSTDKLVRRKITAIKGKFRDLAKWDDLFSTIKAGSFPASIKRTFDLEGNPLAAIWRYNPLDEQGEFRHAYDHRDMNGRVYAVRGNWAIEKGLMQAGQHGYVDDIIQPAEEFDCMCYYQWLYSFGALPKDMITAKGEAELRRVKKELANLPGQPADDQGPTKRVGTITVTRSKNQSAQPKTPALPRIADEGGLIRRVMGWLGRRGG